MRTLSQQMATYAAYHRNPLNRLTHFAGVPLIMFSILIVLSWLRFPAAGFQLTAAMLLVAVVLFYYFILDAMLALAMTVFTLILLAGAHRVALYHPEPSAWLVFAACFIGGWILQLLGHVFEGRRPALADNVWQVFVAPIFLMAEAFFALGFKRDLRARVQAELDAPRPGY